MQIRRATSGRQSGMAGKPVVITNIITTHQKKTGTDQPSCCLIGPARSAAFRLRKRRNPTVEAQRRPWRGGGRLVPGVDFRAGVSGSCVRQAESVIAKLAARRRARAPFPTPGPCTVETSLTSSPTPAAAALAFEEARDLFLSRTRHTRSGSSHTARAYRTDLNHFGAFLRARSLGHDSVTRHAAEIYLARLAAAAAPRTVRRRVSCIRSFYRFLRGIEAVQTNPFDALDLPSFDRKSETHKVLSDDELERIAEQLAADVRQRKAQLDRADPGNRVRVFGKLFTAARRRACFSLMAFSGLRSAEVRHLQKESLVARDDGFYLSFVGKGGKRRTVPLVGFAYPAMFDWLSVRRAVPSRATEVFVTLAGNGLVANQLTRDCERAGQRARTRHRLSPHVLRRTCATRAHRSSGDLPGVQKLLGHASIQTTEVYVHVDEEALRELVESVGVPGSVREHARGPILA